MQNTEELEQEKEMQLHKAESLSRVALTLVDDLYSTGRVAVTENSKEILQKINDLQIIISELNNTLKS